MKRTIRLITISTAITLILFAGLTTLTIRTVAQSEDKAISALPPEARHFDFWVGNWNGTIAGGISAPNSITSFGIGGGIAILESFNGGSGTSISVYNTKEQKWYQTWFDTDQLLIEVTGEFQNGRMILVGQETRTTTGAKLIGRESWFNITDNRYDFTYEVSANGGQTFQPSLSARFVKNAATASASKNTVNSSSTNLAPSALPSQFRQFDFLRGDWEVTTTDCLSPATSTVTLFGQGGGIAVLEDYKCGGDYRGTSVSFYSTQTGRWHHLWLDTEGLLLELRGNRQSGDMVLEGEFTDPDTKLVLLGRTTFSNITSTAFDRKFEVSEDGGQTWTTKSTYTYVKPTVFQPESFTASSVKSKKVGLRWVDRSPKEKRYEVLQWDGAQWVIVKTLKANTTKVTVKKLQSATEYKFAVRACDKNRCSQQAELTVTTP